MKPLSLPMLELGVGIPWPQVPPLAVVQHGNSVQVHLALEECKETEGRAFPINGEKATSQLGRLTDINNLQNQRLPNRVVLKQKHLDRQKNLPVHVMLMKLSLIHI